MRHLLPFDPVLPCPPEGRLDFWTKLTDGRLEKRRDKPKCLLTWRVGGQHSEVFKLQHGVWGVEGFCVIWHFHVHYGLTKLHYFCQQRPGKAPTSRPCCQSQPGYPVEEIRLSQSSLHDKSLPNSHLTAPPAPSEGRKARHDLVFIALCLSSPVSLCPRSWLYDADKTWSKSTWIASSVQ